MELNKAILLLSVIISWVISLLVCVWLITRGAGLRIIDVPNERSSHALPTPRGGGIGIVLGIVIPLVILYCLKYFIIDKKNAFIVLGMILIALTGYCSDRFNMSVRLRLALQSAISLIMVIGAGNVKLPFIQNISVVMSVITVLWMTSLVNIYNFMDGIDGLAGLQGILLGIGTMTFGFVLNNHNLIFSGIILAGAVFGFLVLNVTPAKIFMGDTGSYALGFYAASIPLIDGRLLAPVIIVTGVFIFDTIVTLARRVCSGERWFEAHRSHFYQRAVGLGYTHMQVTGSISVVSAVFTLLAVIYLYASNMAKLIILLFCLIVLTGLALWVKNGERIGKPCS